MKYKYTRKEIVEKLVESVKAGVGYYKIDGSTFHEIKDNLLATGSKYGNISQKEDKKECKHKLGDKEEHDNLGTYHIAGDTCVKCGKHIMDWDNPTPSPEKECKHEGDKTDWHPQFCRKCGAEFMYDFSTPSPLEIEELREVKFGMDSNQTFENFYDAINSLIRNQKKLYQFIKEKK